jgi:hypothetical protein
LEAFVKEIMLRVMAARHILPMWLYFDAGGESIGEVPQPGRFLYDRRIMQQLFECFLKFLVK